MVGSNVTRSSVKFLSNGNTGLYVLGVGGGGDILTVPIKLFIVFEIFPNIPDASENGVTTPPRNTFLDFLFL